MTTAAAVLTQSWAAPKTKEVILQEWLEAQNDLTNAKEREQMLRKQVVAMFAFNSEKKEGIEYLDLANGYKLKAQKALTYTIDKSAIEGILDRMESDGEAGKLLADRLIKWSPTLSISEYKDLPTNYRALVDTAVTTKEAMPKLELVAPKGT